MVLCKKYFVTYSGATRIAVYDLLSCLYSQPVKLVMYHVAVLQASRLGQAVHEPVSHLTCGQTVVGKPLFVKLDRQKGSRNQACINFCKCGTK